MATSCQGFFLVFGALVSHLYASHAASKTDPIPYICSTDTPAFDMDTALFIIMNDKNTRTDLRLFVQSEECLKCNLMPKTTVKQGTNCSILVDTRWPVRMEIRSLKNGSADKVTPSCSEGNLTTQFLEYGMYSIYIKLVEDEFECTDIVPMNAPPDANIPIYVALGIGVFVALFWILMKYLYRRGVLFRIAYCWSSTSTLVHQYSTQDLGSPNNINSVDDSTKEETTPKKERLRSLDTFRGLSLVVMNFVNYGGGGYWFFEHSDWNGLTVPDLVFPWFVWIMGTSMIFSFNGQLKRNPSRLMFAGKIVKRAAILFMLGLLLNTAGDHSGVELSKIRIPGVLQRFAVTYLIVGIVHLFFAKTADENQHQRWAPVRDILDYWPEWIIHLAMVGVWLTLTFSLQVPDCPTGYLGPGGLHDGGKHFNCTGGAAGYIDRLVFGENHIYPHPTAYPIYHASMPFDPEGVLGTLTSCFMCFLGLQAGKIIFQQKDWVQRSKRFIIWGVVLGIIAAILCKASKNDGWIPVCKNLWSLSFVLALSSMAFFLFCFCYLLIDVWKVWNGAPFCYPGLNAISLYIGHELFTHIFPVYFRINHQTHANQLAMSVWGTFLWFLFAFYMYYKEIIVTI